MMGNWLRRRSPKYWPKWYRIVLICSAGGAVLGGVLAWFGPGWGRYAALAGVILCVLCLFFLESILDGPDLFDSDDP